MLGIYGKGISSDLRSILESIDLGSGRLSVAETDTPGTVIQTGEVTLIESMKANELVELAEEQRPQIALVTAAHRVGGLVSGVMYGDTGRSDLHYKRSIMASR